MSCISKEDYYSIIKAGLTPKKHQLGAFAEACFDGNSAEELLEALKMRKADKTDMEEWGITASEWRGSMQSALELMAHYFELEHNFDDAE